MRRDAAMEGRERVCANVLEAMLKMTSSMGGAGL
jgi:hypothetical protein